MPTKFVNDEYAGRAAAAGTVSARGSRAACLERLATALAGYGDLAVAVRMDGPAPCLAARNTAIPDMSETVTVSRSGDGLAYMWSWGRPIAGTSDPDSAAQAIAYVLAAGCAVADEGA